MRPLVLAAVLALAGCDLLEPEPVRDAVLIRVAVDRLPLERRWDGGLHGPNPPDVYVDVYAGGGAFSFTPEYRSPVTEDVRPGDLPLVYALDRPLRVPLDQPVLLNVADFDGYGDDEMFTSGPFTFGDRYGGAAPGEIETLTVADSASAVRLTVRWE